LSSHNLIDADSDLSAVVDPRAGLQAATVTLGRTKGLIGQTFTIVLILIFLWLETAHLPAKLRRHLDPATYARLAESAIGIRRYVSLKAMMSLITGALVAILCAILDVPYAILLGSIAFAFNFIPAIGSILAAIPAVLITLVNQDPSSAAMVAAGYLVINIGIGNVIEPRCMGRGLGLSPLAVIVSLFAWGWLLGPIGMLLAVPLTTLVKAALELSEQGQLWASILGPPLSTSEEPA
jgi:predicted PurR-regulated permease PerM